MPRPPKLHRKKQGNNEYWYAKIAGTPRTFGNCSKVSFADAQASFARELAALSKKRSKRVSSGSVVFVSGMMDAYIDWAEARNKRVCTKTANLRRLARFVPPGHKKPLARWRAADVTVTELSSFVEHLQSLVDAREITAWTAWSIHTDAQACWNWAAGTKDHQASHLPPDHRPFEGIRRKQVPRAELNYDSLLTEDEVKLLMERAEPAGVRNVFEVLHGTGARPGELCGASVGEFDAKQSQIIRHDWKNANSTGRPRRIRLKKRLAELVASLCDGKKPDEPIFTGLQGRRCTAKRAGVLFARMRGDGVRPHHRLYSFRHLWISNALRNGVSVRDTAELAGTSSEMIEKTYGHFAESDLRDIVERI